MIFESHLDNLLSVLLLEQVIVPDGLQRALPTSAILRFCGNEWVLIILAKRKAHILLEHCFYNKKGQETEQLPNRMEAETA